jgi:hypothetical protein
MSDWWDGFIALGTFLFGFWIAFRSEQLRSKIAKADRLDTRDDHRLDREADQKARSEELLEKRTSRNLENQLAWLVELQDVLSDFMRDFGRIHHTDLVELRGSEGRRVRLPPVSEQLDEEANLRYRRAIVLASRIQAEKVRMEVQKLMAHYQFYIARPEIDMAGVMDRGEKVARSFSDCIQILGEQLRLLSSNDN